MVWRTLIIPADIDGTNSVIVHGLSCPTKYVRIIQRELNGKQRWYAQLVCEGLPYVKPQNYVSNRARSQCVNVAFVGDKQVGLLPFAQSISTFEQAISTLQQGMERSRRATNPDNYEPDFTAKWG